MFFIDDKDAFYSGPESWILKFNEQVHSFKLIGESMSNYKINGKKLSLPDAIVEFEKGDLEEKDKIDFLNQIINDGSIEDSPRSIKNAIMYYVRFGLLSDKK